MKQTSYEISKVHVKDFNNKVFIAHKDESGQDLITLEHGYFMKILEDKERFRVQAMARGKKR